MTVPWAALIGAGLGAYQFEQQRQQEEKDRRLAAATARYRPWTGLTPGEVQQPNIFGTVGAGALSGYQMDQAEQEREANKPLREAQIGYFKRAGGGQQANQPIDYTTEPGFAGGPNAQMGPPTPEATRGYLPWLEMMRLMNQPPGTP